MSVIELLRQASAGDSLTPAAQRAICAALRQHLYADTDLDRALGLKLDTPGPTPRRKLLRTLRDKALRRLYRAVQDERPGRGTSGIVHDLLARRSRACYPPADEIEALAEEVLELQQARTLLSARSIRRIAGVIEVPVWPIPQGSG